VIAQDVESNYLVADIFVSRQSKNAHWILFRRQLTRSTETQYHQSAMYYVFMLADMSLSFTYYNFVINKHQTGRWIAN